MNDCYDFIFLHNHITTPVLEEFGSYILMNDIDMSEDTCQGGDYDCGTGWDAIETFGGTLDGNDV